LRLFKLKSQEITNKQEILIQEIDIGDRIRKDVGDVSDLAISIKNNGLIHPISVTKNGKLVAGRRRIETFKKLGLEEIPFTITDIAIKENGDISKRRIKISQKRRESVNAVSECLKELAKLQCDSLNCCGRRSTPDEYTIVTSLCSLCFPRIYVVRIEKEK
jgi:hypothetical protein